MSPRPLDPEVRSALIETAARLLAEHGDDALTTRRLAAELGTSTMSVYTHFRGMEDLRRAVAVEGFERLARFLDEVKDTDDPVADVAACGGAYFLNAITNPDLYRFMFSERAAQDDPDVGHGTFERLVAGVERAIAAKRFDERDPLLLATQLWAMAHGIVTLHLSGLLTLQEAIDCCTDMGCNLFIGFGDDPRAARTSVTNAIELYLTLGPRS